MPYPYRRNVSGPSMLFQTHSRTPVCCIQRIHQHFSCDLLEAKSVSPSCHHGRRRRVKCKRLAGFLLQKTLDHYYIQKCTEFLGAFFLLSDTIEFVTSLLPPVAPLYKIIPLNLFFTVHPLLQCKRRKKGQDSYFADSLSKTQHTPKDNCQRKQFTFAGPILQGKKILV